MFGFLQRPNRPANQNPNYKPGQYSGDKQPSLKFKFVQLATYDHTFVSIHIKIPFRKLHLLYRLPLIILKAYQATRYTLNHPVSKTGSGFNLLELTEDDYTEEKTTVDAIENMGKEFDTIQGFPSYFKVNQDSDSSR